MIPRRLRLPLHHCPARIHTPSRRSSSSCRPLPHQRGDLRGLQVLQAQEDAALGAEADDDAGHAEEEGLGPELEEFAVEESEVLRGSVGLCCGLDWGGD